MSTRSFFTTPFCVTRWHIQKGLYTNKYAYGPTVCIAYSISNSSIPSCLVVGGGHLAEDHHLVGLFPHPNPKEYPRRRPRHSAPIDWIHWFHGPNRQQKLLILIIAMKMTSSPSQVNLQTLFSRNWVGRQDQKSGDVANDVANIYYRGLCVGNLKLICSSYLSKSESFDVYHHKS